MFRLLPLAAAFGLAIWQMRFDWIYNETYHYGWTVLPLALYLFSLRWGDRPSPGGLFPACALTAGWILLGTAYPLIWLIREANPEWRLIGVALAFLAVLTSLQYLAAGGGRAWVKHFAGPVLFFLTSIPWPDMIEKSATAFLMPANASIALEVLHWFSIPAIRSGHLITIAGGTLGVEEACSGIRSLQSTLMMAWFLGELHHLRFSSRATLLASGVAFALVTNSLRTIGLSTAAARSGLEAAHSWHDAAGLIALGANVACLFLLAAYLNRPTKGKSPGARPAPASASFAPPAPPPALAVPLTVSLRSLTGFSLAIVLMFPLTAWWYGRRVMPPLPPWHLVPPVSAAGYRAAKISDETYLMVRPSSGWSARWTTSGGHPLHGFYFEWKPGLVPPENMNVHHPGGCLGTLGIEFLNEQPPLSLMFDGISLTARHLVFDDHGRPLHLLYLLSETTAPDPRYAAAPRFEYTYADRFRAVLQGRRNPGQRLIETGLWDETSPEAARVIFTTFLQTVFKAGPPL